MSRPPEQESSSWQVGDPVPDWVRGREAGVEIRVRLSPKASRDQVTGLYGDRVKIQLTAPPVAGAANKALARFIARAAGVAPSSVRVVAGMKDRSKTVLIDTVEVRAVIERVAAKLTPGDEAELAGD